MRKEIISELAVSYRKEESEILNILKNKLKIASYTTKVTKNRTVINKTNIKIEEQIVLDYYKLLLNRHCSIKFPNRSYVMTELMNIMPILHRYKAYTIYKFDIKDFFYNISPLKSFAYLANEMSLKTNEFSFLKNYTNSQKGLLPGVGLHNSLVEICGGYFDLAIKKTFKEGFLYYSRYVDDCILILDEKVSKDIIEDEVLKLVKNYFGNKSLINLDKTQYVDSECTNYEIDYLGYVFQKGQSTNNQFKFGIAKKKLDKYTMLINDIVLEYGKTNNLKILDLKLDLMFKRVVYYGTRKNNEKYRWQVRGISDSYKELKRFMKNNEDYTKITKDTERFFEKSILISFSKNRIKIPARINNQLKNKKFISSYLNNNALLLHKKLGLNYRGLKEKLSIVNNDSTDNYSYSELANLFLSKIK